MKQALIVVIALAIGFVAGFVMRPMMTSASGSPLAPMVSSQQPTEAEATAAVRRHKSGFFTFKAATLKLGECSPSGITVGVSCMTQVVLSPGSAPQNRAIGFARVNGQWEVSLW
jgi:hypothetical protein